MKNAKEMTSNGEKLNEISRLPPLRHPDEDMFDQHSQSDMTSTAELHNLSAEAAKERIVFPVTPLPVRNGETIVDADDTKVTDTLSSSWLNGNSFLTFFNNGGSSNHANSNDSNITVTRSTSRSSSSDPTVASKTSFASCIVEVRDIPVKSEPFCQQSQSNLTLISFQYDRIMFISCTSRHSPVHAFYTNPNLTI